MDEVFFLKESPQWLLAVLVLWNAAAFLLMGYDKLQAKRGGWRVRERTLFALSFLFAGAGILGGMTVFRHKTRHRSFQILVPAGIAVDLAIAAYFAWKATG